MSALGAALVIAGWLLLHHVARADMPFAARCLRAVCAGVIVIVGSALLLSACAFENQAGAWWRLKRA